MTHADTITLVRKCLAGKGNHIKLRAAYKLTRVAALAEGMDYDNRTLNHLAMDAAGAAYLAWEERRNYPLTPNIGIWWRSEAVKSVAAYFKLIGQ